MLKNINHSIILIIMLISGCNNGVTSNEKAKYTNADYSLLITSQKDFKNGELYLMTEDGKGIKRLTINTFGEGDAEFSPNGKIIAFSSYWNNDNTNIYLINVEDKNISQLTSNIFYNKEPNWSPDGESIVYASGRSGDAYGYNIYKTNVKEFNKIRLAYTDGAWFEDPVWSPDGTKIAYIKEEDWRNAQNIYIMTIDGSKKHKITNDSNATHNFDKPQWISNKIISVYDHHDRNPRIIKINIITGEQEVIMNELEGTGSLYVWSPDFSKIAYSKYVLGTNGEDGDNEIFIYNLKTETKKRVTNNLGHDFILDWR